MTIDQLAGEFNDVLVDAWLLGVGDLEGRLTGHAEAAGGQP